MNRRIRTALGVALTATLVTTAAPAPAAAHDRRPSVIALPDGFQPEGVAAAGRYAWFGSRATGEIYRADLITGAGRQVSPATGTPSLGLKVDRRGRLFVAGGTAGDARVIDTRTGAVLARYRFADAPTFVNDVTLTRDAAWFTDSNRPVLYRLPLGRGGKLPPADGFTTLPLTGDFQQSGTGVNLNGIVPTPDGRGLIVVQSNTGTLFRVDPATGGTTAVDVPGTTFANGDGLLLLGRTLYVVQNRLNQVAVVELNRAGTTGVLRRVLTDPDFDVPTTVAAALGRLYLPNARFSTPPTPATPYTAVAVDAR
ncbi:MULTISPECIES: superoxide dismutase [unclassified Micromonospora]|uniref:superoxide dismutase n=1 Tax=unclassified Micromonospora TaxID=2617518 RepID=UPI001C239EDC|nr:MULTISPECIES: superoxide dismutase [unclassified Micromonospora]MBU8861085.1 superoxide dismutase [Micromonospora sp. WMMB482]MDM4780632.1 superoxide dismutase [Micromonospora sp. b486]